VGAESCAEALDDLADALDGRDERLPVAEEAGRVMPAPTPGGVPVKIRSPGRSSRVRDSRATSSGTEKISCTVVPSCTTARFPEAAVPGGIRLARTLTQEDFDALGL
jgi:hypothetical protein